MAFRNLYSLPNVLICFSVIVKHHRYQVQHHVTTPPPISAHSAGGVLAGQSTLSLTGAPTAASTRGQQCAFRQPGEGTVHGGASCSGGRRLWLSRGAGDSTDKTAGSRLRSSCRQPGAGIARGSATSSCGAEWCFCRPPAGGAWHGSGDVFPPFTVDNCVSSTETLALALAPRMEQLTLVLGWVVLHHNALRVHTTKCPSPIC